MLYRTVPKNNDKLSILGFGAMRLPGKKQKIDEQEAEKQILYAIDKGVNYIDTAYTYHNGKSEIFLGKIISKNNNRNKIKLATKLPHWAARNKNDLMDLLNEQLRKLRTDYIDYYLVHNLNGSVWEKAKRKGLIEFLDEAIKQGKIINPGFSYHGNKNDFAKIVDGYNWINCLLQYNYLDQENQAGISGVKYASSKNIAVMIMEPLRGGVLARKQPKEIQDIWNKSTSKRSPAEWSLRWIWNHPEVTVILSGMNSEKQIDENIEIASVAKANSLTNEENDLINETASTLRKLMKIGCTSCQYCMPCPQGVNIPSCFEQYNSYHTFNNKFAKFSYLIFNGGLADGNPSLASQCTDCKKCISKCPQNIQISEILKRVKKDLESFMTKPLIWMIKKRMKVRN